MEGEWEWEGEAEEDVDLKQELNRCTGSRSLMKCPPGQDMAI